MERKENIVILSLEEYDKMRTQLCFLNKKRDELMKLKWQYDDLRVECELARLQVDMERKAHRTTISVKNRYYYQLERLKKELSLTRIIRCILLKWKRKIKKVLIRFGIFK